MRTLGLTLLVALFCAAPAHALDLVRNGDFESELEANWRIETAGLSTFTIRATPFEPDGDYEVLAQKGTGNGHAKIYQVVPIPTTELDFSIRVKLQASATATGPWSASGVFLYYEDFFGNILGTTAIVDRTLHCPWTESAVLRLIDVPDAEWHEYGFDLAAELENFPGLDPEQVKQVRISLTSLVGGDC